MRGHIIDECAIIIVRELPCLSDGIVLFMVHIPTFFIFFFHLVCFGVGGACQHAAALRSSTRQLDTWREDMFWRGSPCRLDSIFAYTWQKLSYTWQHVEAENQH